MVPKMAVVVRQVLAKGGRAQGRLILQHRQDALSVITSFLSASRSGLQGLIKAFIRLVAPPQFPSSSSQTHRRVKKTQDLARCRFRLNFSRLTLLTMLFDRTMKILFSYVGLLLGGKLPKTLELSVLNRLKERNDPTVIQNLISIPFFTKFNDFLSRNPNANKSWRATRQDILTGKYECDPILKERLLVDLLMKIRRRHISRVLKTRVKSEIPLVREEDVREFIRGGKDPLHDHMVLLDPIESLLKQFQKGDEISSLILAHQQRNRKTFPPLLLLHTVTAEDLYDTARLYLEKYCSYKSKREKQLPGGSPGLAPGPPQQGARGRRRATLLKSYKPTKGSSSPSSSVKDFRDFDSADDMDSMIRPAAPTPSAASSLIPAPPTLEKPSDSRKFRKI